MDLVLSDDQLEKAASNINLNWAILPGKGLVRIVPTGNFGAGFGLVSVIAEVAEQNNHHPEIILRYSEVEVSLISHEAGGITNADIKLAQAIDGLIAAAGFDRLSGELG